MLSILAIVLGLVIITSAVAADRSARARHPFRAIVLNLFGIGCLLVGLFSVYAWCHHSHLNRSLRVAVAQPDRASMVRLVGDSDGRRQRTDTEARPEAVGVELVEQAEAAEQPATPVDEEIQLDELGQPEDNASDTEVLSLPEISQAEIDFDARPQWVDQPDRDLGEIHQISVASGPYKHLRTARKELDHLLKAATDEYINDVVGNPHAAHWVGYDEDEVRVRFVAPDHFFDEQIISPSVGVMHQSHALLEFGPAFHNEVEQSWYQVMARARLAQVALGAAAILGMLVLLFGYFNADTATRGFYSGRLKFVTAVAILAVIATGFFVARSIPWLWL